MKSTWTRLFWITLGVVSMALGTHLFLVPNDLATGGVTGIAIVIHFVFPVLNVGTIMLAGNIILFILGWFLLGRQFGLLTLYATFLYSVLTALAERFFPMHGVVLQDTFVNLLLGCVLMGIGLALVFQQNASTGGTDIIAKIVNTYVKIPLATSMFLTDLFVVGMSAFLISVEKSLYAVIGIWLQSAIIDKAIAGWGKRIVMTIVSSQYEVINTFINGAMNRGSTIYQAQGGYSGEYKQILVTVVHRAEYVRITEYIQQVDPKAFVTIHYVNEVIGEGFSYASPLDVTPPQELEGKESS